VPRVHLENPVQRGVKARVLTISAPVIGCLTSLDLAGGFPDMGILPDTSPVFVRYVAFT
jgi:hypothetical protein